MQTEENMEDRLWDYIDGLSSTAERSAVEALIAAHAEWQRKYKELLDVHQLTFKVELDEPSLRFTRNVMEEIARQHMAPAAKTYINKNIIRGIGAFFLSLIGGLLVFLLVQIKWSSSGGSSGKKINLEIPFDRIDYGKVFGSLPVSLFMLVTVIIGLVLLDMYLQRRRQANA